MAQKIKQGNIFGRIGTGIGKGITEALPEEIARHRLSSGLQQFEQNYQDLTPIQQLARLSSVPGVTPQMIQTFSELARQQAKTNAFRNTQGQIQPGQITSSPNMNEQYVADMMNKQQQQQNVPQNIPQQNIQGGQNVQPNERGQPQIVNINPLDESSLTRPPWTPQQRNSRIGQYIDQGFLPDQAQSLASDDEQRDLAAPGALQARYKELEERRDKARTEFKRHLETKLQKTSANVFQDLTGENLINLERGMERDLRSNPKSTIEDVANDWSNRALQLAKTKTQFDKTANGIGLNSLFTGEKSIKKLKEYSKIYEKAGNSEEYFNELKSKIGLSPQAAADISYPINTKLKTVVDSYKPISGKREETARKAAIDIEDKLTTNDSLLSMAWQLRNKDPSFDQQAFFDQLSEDQDQIRLNERQRRELAEGVSDIIANWADLLVFPLR